MSFARENTLRLDIGAESLFPDAAFELVATDDRAFSFHVELDNGTERIRSQKHIDSWERKIRLYDAYQDRCDGRFRVLVVTTRSRDRLHHILDAANALVRNPQRSLFYGIDLTSFVGESNPLFSPCFRDRRGNAVSLIPSFVSLPIVAPSVRQVTSPVLV